jgi:hypothetical protein
MVPSHGVRADGFSLACGFLALLERPDVLNKDVLNIKYRPLLNQPEEAYSL